MIHQSIITQPRISSYFLASYPHLNLALLTHAARLPCPLTFWRDAGGVILPIPRMWLFTGIMELTLYLVPFAQV